MARDECPETKRRRVEEARRRQRVGYMDGARGMAVCFFVGDARGAPKFMHHRNVAVHGIGPENVLRQGQGVHAKWHNLAQLTDDSEISMLVLRLLADGEFEKDAYVAAMHQWYESGPICCGKNTKALFSVKPGGFQARRAEVVPSDSNGFLMCCWPFSLVEDDAERRRCLRLHSDVVCPSRTCREMCTLYCDLLRICLGAPTVVAAKLDVRTHLVLWLNPDWGMTEGQEAATKPDPAVQAAVLRAMKRDMDAEFAKDVAGAETKGKATTTFAVAVWALLHQKTASDGLVAVLGLGGDTNTNAAVAGALLGAAMGETEALSGAQGAALRKDYKAITECEPEITRMTEAGEVRTRRPKAYSYRLFESQAVTCWIDQQRGWTPGD